MTTQTVLSAPPEEIEKEEGKKMEAEIDWPPPKESTKPEESACPAAAESEVKVTEAAVIQEDDLKHTISDEEEPKGVSTEQKPVELPPQAEAKVDVELPPTLDEKKTEDSLIVDICTPEVAIPAHDTACAVAESTTEKEDIESESQKQDEDTNVEPVQEKPEETENVVYVPKSSPAEVVEEKEEGDVTIPEAESTPQEECVPEKIEKVTPVPEKVELKSPDDEVEDTKLSEKKETCAIESSDEAKLEAPTIQVEEKHVDSNPIGEETERAKDTDEVTGQSEEKGVEPGTNEIGVAEVKSVVAEELVPCEEKATDDAKDTVEVTGVDTGKNEIGVAEEKSVVAEELVPCEEKATDDAKDTVEVTGVDTGKNETGVAEEKSVVAEELVLCEEKATDDAKDTVEATGVDTGKNETGVAEEKSVVAEELVLCEEKATEDAKDEAVSRDVEPDCGKGNKEDESTKKVDEKIEQTVEATDDKEEEKQAVQNQECAKDSEDTKTYQDVPVKKQSFVKIMKQSLVKAKKAIIGKSQNPKMPASEARDDGNK
ncbi:hypothetical protein ACS0TY_005447 [Phlomoides rotata]